MDLNKVYTQERSIDKKELGAEDATLRTVPFRGLRLEEETEKANRKGQRSTEKPGACRM